MLEAQVRGSFCLSLHSIERVIHSSLYWHSLSFAFSLSLLIKEVDNLVEYKTSG